MAINKKGIELITGAIAALVIIFIAVLLIVPIFPKILYNLDDSLKDEACKINIGLRRYEIQSKIAGVTAVSARAPLAGCVTIDKGQIPKKGESREAVERGIAELMKSCWQRYDEGKVRDVFKEGTPWINNCQTCYLFTVKQDADIKSPIAPEEFMLYLQTTPFKPKDTTDRCFTSGTDRGGFCANSKADCISPNKMQGNPDQIQFDFRNSFCRKDQKGEGCCFSNIQCVNNGGRCSKDSLGFDYALYTNWQCPKGESCYIKKENDLSYYTYFQRANGPGNVFILTDIKPNEIYAISFGSPADTCDTTLCKSLSIGTGFVIGGAAAVGVGIAIVALPITLPLSITATAIGVIGGGIGITAGVFAGQAVETINVGLADFFNPARSASTIYLTSLSQIENKQVQGGGEPLCSVIPS
ncbi:hypothetical protein HYV81_03805 [Candidatus Woesearchaeota archaeon]|nr:hypothetical protein [Candidatus Woesearchaeota archaeon]